MRTFVRILAILAAAAVVAGAVWLLVPQIDDLTGSDRERPQFEEFQPGDLADGAVSAGILPEMQRERPGGGAFAVADLVGTLVKMGAVIAAVAGGGWLLTRRRRRSLVTAQET